MSYKRDNITLASLSCTTMLDGFYKYLLTRRLVTIEPAHPSTLMLLSPVLTLSCATCFMPPFVTGLEPDVRFILDEL